MVLCEDHVASVNDLPDDCLVIIFRWLDTCTDRNAYGLTCRRWLQIQNFACNSLKCRFTPNVSREYVRCLSRLLNRFQRLSSLSLAGCTELPDLALTQLPFSGSSIRSISLDCCLHITDNGFALVSVGCPSLVSISLYRCYISDAGLEILATSCLALEVVNLCYCVHVSDKGIRTLSRECTKLRALTISYCRNITGVGFRGCSKTLSYLEADSCLLTLEGIPEVVSGGGLMYLNVSNLRSWICGDGLDGIGNGMASRLRFLNMRMCRFVGDESVEAIAKGCPVLKEWSIAVCHEVRLPGWEAIGSNCQKLEILHVNRCRNLCDGGLRALQQGCHRLAVLYMHGCRRVTPVGLEMFKCARGGVVVKPEECMCVGPSLEEFLLG